VFSWILCYTVHSVWHVIKFRSSLRQTAVNSTVDGQLKENQLKISTVLLFVSVDVMTRAFCQMADIN